MVEKINAYRPTLLVIKLNRRRPRDLQPTRRWKDTIKTYLKDAEPKRIFRLWVINLGRMTWEVPVARMRGSRVV
jgi:hypothetical protein